MNTELLTGTSGLFSALDKCGKFVVMAHAHPDGDACGCVTAMKSFLEQGLGKSAAIVLPDRWGSGVDFLMTDSGAVLASEDPGKAESLISGADALICLDFNVPSRIAPLENALRSAKAVKILIDHHIGPDRDSFDLVFSDTGVSSACELLYWILLRHPSIGDDPSRLPGTCATALMTGMTTDSNNFANSVFPSTLRMASGLLAAGVDRDRILRKLYNEKRECVVRAWSHMMDRRLNITPEGVAYMVLSKETKERFNLLEGDTDGLVNIPLGIGKVCISALLTEDDGHYRLSLRSKEGVSVNLLARECFHGGGHERASGGKVFFPGDIDCKEQIEEYFTKKTAQFLHGTAGKNKE